MTDPYNTILSPFDKSSYLTEIGKKATAFLGVGGEVEVKDTTSALGLGDDPVKSLTYSLALDTPSAKTLFGTNPPAKVEGLQSVLLIDASQFCCAYIGAGQGKFCLALKNQCSVASHCKSDRFEANMPGPFMCVKVKRANAALAHPLLDVSKVPEAIIQDLLRCKLESESLWSVRFHEALLNCKEADILELTRTSR